MKRKKRGRIHLVPGFMVFALSLVLIARSSAWCQDKYPSGPIELIVTFAAGGAADSAGRSLAPYLSKYLGVPVVVKNVPPPRTGEDVFSRSKPDGYTIGVLAGVAVASDETFFHVRFQGKKFDWIGTNAASPGLIFSNAKGPIQNFDDLAKVGAKRPIKIGAFSKYSSTTIATMIALEEKKIPYTFVTGFKGAAPALTSMIRGEVDIMGTTLTSASAFYKSGDVKPLVIFQSEPDPDVPDAPTLEKVGLSPSSGYLGSVVFALAAPPGTSKAVRDTLAAAHKKAVEDPQYRAQLKKIGFSLSYVPPDKVHQWINNIYEAYAKIKPMVQAEAKKK
ncbi:MAG TPA: tripartite tricarboxylate transporter substrate-binding protein [Terriglobales bacterium]|nr:tripartite tricarboxylate transporter substrate-binding protein [Terriglobales bacterium]